MPYTQTLSFASGLATQTASALPSTWPRSLTGRTATILGATSGATGYVIATTVLTAVVSGGGASGGQVSGAQFTVDPATQSVISGYAIASGQSLQLTTMLDGELPYNP